MQVIGVPVLLLVRLLMLFDTTSLAMAVAVIVMLVFLTWKSLLENTLLAHS